MLLDADMSKIKSDFISNFAAYLFRMKNVKFLVVEYQAHVPAFKQKTWIIKTIKVILTKNRLEFHEYENCINFYYPF